MSPNKHWAEALYVRVPRELTPAQADALGIPRSLYKALVDQASDFVPDPKKCVHQFSRYGAKCAKCGTPA